MDSKGSRSRCVLSDGLEPGSSEPGLAIQRSKLGGKDPAYVRADADLNYTVAELVDGT